MIEVVYGHLRVVLRKITSQQSVKKASFCTKGDLRVAFFATICAFAAQQSLKSRRGTLVCFAAGIVVGLLLGVDIVQSLLGAVVLVFSSLLTLPLPFSTPNHY